MKKPLLFSSLNLIMILCTSLSLFSQNVAITDDDTYTASPSAMLDVKSLSKGMLVPRLTTAQRNAVSTPATGLLVFDIDVLSFYFYNGTSWTNLSSGNANGIIGYTAPDKVYLNDITDKFGIGTVSPNGKLDVKSDVSIGNEKPIFNVVNSTGDTVFAVYEQGVRINVYDDPLAKATGSKGGFAVGGFSPAKAGVTNEYLRITPDSIRLYVEDDPLLKASGNKGGFAVGGFSPAKAGFTNEYLRITPDSVRIYIEEGSAEKAIGNKGGFAVGGFSPAKSIPSDYFNIYGSSAAATLAQSEARIFWYPLKEAMLSGRVLVQSPDSVGTNSFATGYESKAVGNYSQALGYKCISRGQYSTAIGYQSEAIGDNSFAIGYKAKAKGSNLPTVNPAFAFGNQSYAKSGALALGNISFADFESVSIGTESVSNGQYSVALGYQSRTDGYTAVSVGYWAKANADFSTALGPYSICDGYYSTAIGFNAKTSGVWSTAIGNYDISENTTFGPNAIGNYSLAIGILPKAVGDGSVCISTSLTDTCSSWGKNSFVIGSRAHSAKTGAIVFGDDPGLDPNDNGIQYVKPTADNQFVVRAKGGYLFHTTAAMEATKTVFIKGNDGSLGIGTITPDNALDINGKLSITQSTGNEMVVINGNAWVHSAGNQIFGTGGGYFLMASKEGMGESAGIRGDGNNVTIWSPGDNDRLLRLLDEDFFDATNTDPNDNTAEKAYINAAGQYFQVSDMNKKQNISKIQNASSKISSLSGYTYEYKINQEEVSKGQQINSTAGVLAQELQSIFPQAVQANESGELFVNYSAILPLLIEAIKEQQAKIENLETIINQIQNK